MYNSHLHYYDVYIRQITIIAVFLYFKYVFSVIFSYSRTVKLNSYIFPYIQPKFSKVKKIVISLLIVIAVVMIVLGAKNDMLPPLLTGVGFILIAALFLKQEMK
ncbi:hypothetical protein GCM10010832_14880 [Psychroflexus planctonicus]|uniref:Uncharacterized protein n=1 Tax=Psychroflexus planctonicus TaxID=1526575 RepID=A0ABQ1SHB8_9FLAO|nr:hypothetical protein GCM10010832_14880 [Psychroflexus planctonicus]